MKLSRNKKIVVYVLMILSVSLFIHFTIPFDNQINLSFAKKDINNKTETNYKWDHGKLRVSSKGRFLEHEDGTPFLWIGDTGWELFDRPTLEEINIYFQNRSKKGFTVIQSVFYMHGIDASGHGPFIENNPENMDDKFWNRVDQIIKLAAEYELYMCLLPLFGYHVPKFDSASAANFGEFLGKRYANYPNIIWMLGGDRNPSDEVPVWEALAKSIKKHDQNHLMTYHPAGNQTSTFYFNGHETSWIDFNSYQSGHGTNNPNTWIFATQGLKPVINSGPGFEDIVILFWENCSNYRLTDLDIRKDAYRSVFAGSFGHTYGQSDVWQFRRQGDVSKACSNGYWFEGIHAPGSGHMLHLANLLVSRPGYRTRDTEMITENSESADVHMEATKGKDYAFIYFPKTMTRKIKLGRISGQYVICSWFNPRNGESRIIGTYNNQGSISFTPPKDNLDYILIIDDVGKKYESPGITNLWYGSIKNYY